MSDDPTTHTIVPLQKAGETVELSIPLLLRLMEWACQEAGGDDTTAHRVVEKLLEAKGGKDRPLDMDDFEDATDTGEDLEKSVDDRLTLTLPANFD